MGLDQVVHHAASRIDIETLMATMDQLPDDFLDGVGLSQEVRDALRSVLPQAR